MYVCMYVYIYIYIYIYVLVTRHLPLNPEGSDFQGSRVEAPITSYGRRHYPVALILFC